MENTNSERQEPNSPEYSGRSENDEINKINNLSSDENSHLEKFSCKLPIILDLKQRKTKPHYLNSDLALFEFIVKNLRNKRRTHSINDLDDFTPDNPSKKLILDSVESFLKARNLPKNPKKLSQLKSVKKVGTKKNVSEFGTESCVNSSSCNNNSISNGTGTSTGLLHRVWQNGNPNFEFSTEDPNGVYVANLTKLKSKEKSESHLIYLFYEGGNSRKDVNSRFLGKMRVSGGNIPNQDGSSCKETEFVLYGSNDDYLRETQNPNLQFVKNKGLINKFAGMLKPNFSPLPRYAHKSAKSIVSQIDNIECETGTIEGEISGTKNLTPVPNNNINSDDFLTNYELATIIIKDGEKNNIKNNSESVIGGWGLKFLKKSKQNEKNCRQKVNVLVPKGFHGGPIGTNVGPSSLRERWANGSCACGGWDLGCPISVFSNCPDDSLREKSQDNGSEDLFIEGERNGEVALKIVNVSENLYLVYFGSNFSPLQCFSIAVAMIHAQSPELNPPLEK
ncbi:hypothetical protein LUZ60_014968 [Juncus effusus]|nr:hypothetical protein LUZ60_014968 [Juncus effusus]